jgi:hypothetical protein
MSKLLQGFTILPYLVNDILAQFYSKRGTQACKKAKHSQAYQLKKIKIQKAHAFSA